MLPPRTAAVLALVTFLVAAPAGATTTAGEAHVTTGETPGLAAKAHAGPSDRTTGVAQSTATELSSCTTVTESGEYVLADDVRGGSPTDPRQGLGACIEIRADDVTLRGENHTVAAEPGGTPGVVGVLIDDGESHSNVTVRNLTTTRWGAGVAVLGATGVTIRNVSAVNNLGDGFFAENATDLRLRGGSVSGSNTGVFLRRSPNATLGNLTVADNLAGVSFRRSDGATLRNLSVADHSQFGVAFFRSRSATLADSTLRDDGFAEVALARSSDARLVSVSVADSPGWEVYAVRDSVAVGERVRLGETTLSFEASDVALDADAETPPLPLTDRQVVGESLFVLPTAEDARPSRVSHLSLSVGYAEAAVERARTTEQSLSLWRFDAGAGWTRAGTTLDAEADTAAGEFGNLSENGTVVTLVGEGFAESGNETG